MLSKPIAEKIFRNYKKAADAKDTNSMFLTGVCYSVGYGVTKDEKKALEWCVEAAKAGSPDALFYLTENCEIGEMPVSAEMAFAWYHDAARAGHHRAMWKVVCCYFHGHGTKKSPVECCYWKRQYNDQLGIAPISESLVYIGETSLHRAVRNWDKETVKYILRQEKEKVNTKNKDGQTPLHLAAESGN